MLSVPCVEGLLTWLFRSWVFLGPCYTLAVLRPSGEGHFLTTIKRTPSHNLPRGRLLRDYEHPLCSKSGKYFFLFSEVPYARCRWGLWRRVQRGLCKGKISPFHVSNTGKTRLSRKSKMRVAKHHCPCFPLTLDSGKNTGWQAPEDLGALWAKSQGVFFVRLFFCCLSVLSHWNLYVTLTRGTTESI